jgi:outer membrane immunogenic protein
MIQRCQITRSIACELIERSGASVNDNGTFAYEKVPRSNWNSTLILLKPEGSFHAVVASRLQQFAPALLERPHGLGAFTRNWNFGMKKKLLLVSASLIALSAAAPASAADLAARPYTKAPPMVAAIYDWTGFYIGINGGGGFSHNCWDLVPGGREGCHDASGGTVGGQIGYRWQTGPVVFGVEAQGNWADFTGDNVSALLAQRNRTKIDAFGLFTGQIGYAFNNVLLYAKGGAAVTDTKYDVFAVPGGLLLGSNSNTRWGGVVGAGVEYGFASNWSVGFEYDHLFMDRQTVTFPFLQSDSIKQDVDLFTARVNYRFGGPIVAKY